MQIPRAGSTGNQTQLGVRGDRSKSQIMRWQVAPAQSAFNDTAQQNQIEDWYWTANLHAADSLTKEVFDLENKSSKTPKWFILIR